MSVTVGPPCLDMGSCVNETGCYRRSYHERAMTLRTFPSCDQRRGASVLQILFCLPRSALHSFTYNGWKQSSLGMTCSLVRHPRHAANKAPWFPQHRVLFLHHHLPPAQLQTKRSVCSGWDENTPDTDTLLSAVHVRKRLKCYTQCALCRLGHSLGTSSTFVRFIVDVQNSAGQPTWWNALPQLGHNCDCVFFLFFFFIYLFFWPDRAKSWNPKSPETTGMHRRLMQFTVCLCFVWSAGWTLLTPSLPTRRVSPKRYPGITLKL